MDKGTWLEIEGGRRLPDDADVDFVLEDEGSDYELALFADLCVEGPGPPRPVLIQSWGEALDHATRSILEAS